MNNKLVVAVLVAVTAWVTLCSQQDHMAVNPASRFAVMEALVEHGTFAIDDTALGSRTVDKVQWEGRMYSSKPLLLPVLLAPAYAAVRALTGEGFSEATYPTVRRMRLPSAVLPWLASMLLWIALVGRLTADAGERAVLSIAMIVGGLPTAYASHLDNHSFAFLALLAMAVSGRGIATAPDQVPSASVALAGFCGGAAIAFDLGATPIVGGLGLWAAWTLRGRPAAVAALGASVAFAPLCQTGIQFALTGQLKPFYLLPGAYDYPGSYWRRPIEFDALTEPLPVYAFHTLLGHHGLFSVSPWLLLGLPWLIQREPEQRMESLRRAAVFTLAVVIGYYLLRTNNYGGRCVGMRWWMVVHPILGVGAVRTVTRYDLLRRAPVLLGVLVALSAVSAITGAVNPWEEGWVYALFRGLGMGSVPG